MQKKKNKTNNLNWIIKITILAFFISLIFSIISEITLPKVNIYIGILILIIFIVIGIIFDMIGVAVTASNEEPFHAMSSKKIKGAKKSVFLKRNADKVSSFCNDVIGDICGIISGTAAVTVSTTIANNFNLDILFTTLITTSIVAALTIGGKAACKSIAIKNCNKIVHTTAKFLNKK